MKEPNEGVIEMLFNQVQDKFMVMHIWDQFSREIPQLNSQTRIELVRERYQAMRLVNPEHVDWRDYKPLYYPRAGLKAAWLRFIAPFHKWLIDNRYHPADRPPNWKPMDISAIGMISLNMERSVSMSTREIEFKRYGFSLGFPMLNGGYAGPSIGLEREYVMIVAAYDGQTDTLYLRV